MDVARAGSGLASPVPIGRPRGELATLLEDSYPKARLVEMILDGNLSEQIQRVIREQRHAAEFWSTGLPRDASCCCWDRQERGRR